MVALVLFSISAFTLNHSIHLFAQFPSWVILYLVLFFASFLSLVFRDRLPGRLLTISYFLLGAGLVLVIYFTAYLAPLYPFGFIGMIFLGLSSHLFVPLLLAIAVIIAFIRIQKSMFSKLAFYAGIAVPVIISLVFLIQWNNIKKDIHTASASMITRPDNTLPIWVLLCQAVSTDYFTTKIIEGDLVYDTFDRMWSSGFERNIFDEVKRHDPLVNLGLALVGDINIDRDTRVKILKSQHNARHMAQRKLWSGRDLQTIEVLSNIKVYPDYRLAYTEKIITIKNTSNWENHQQEAAFTFYLPEGSVASSLSLWIDGKEEKSRLTTKAKADSAYRTIVGVERRDPALLHWQEGNTLTVTIFPCTPKENRIFKLGVTTPLRKEAALLKLQNVYFEGPDINQALETTVIEFESAHKIPEIKLPSAFKSEIDKKYTYSGKYQPYWEAECSLTPLSGHAFSFNGNSYRIQELQKQTKSFNPQTVYFDLNKSWSKSEFDEVWNEVKGKKAFVFHDKLIALEEENKNEIFERLHKNNFSLFPFNEIKDVENAIVITKSTELSPNLDDLKETEFAHKLTKGIIRMKDRINVFQLGNTSSPYLSTLKELQLFNFQQGTEKELAGFISKNNFVSTNENTNQVALDISNIMISKDTAQSSATAPDHLLRLFAYNKIMKELGRNYFSKDKIYIEKLAAVANEAYIVSPVSSMIVLETIKDYERFGIEENKNSLKNASMKSSGAVPEPHEWALIAILVMILAILFGRKYWKNNRFNFR